MIEEKKESKSNWVVGFEIFSRVSAWVIGPIIVALIFGKTLDLYFGTAPWIFLTLTVLSFFISIIGIWRILVKYIKNLERELKEKKNDTGEHTN